MPSHPLSRSICMPLPFTCCWYLTTIQAAHDAARTHTPVLPMISARCYSACACSYCYSGRLIQPARWCSRQCCRRGSCPHNPSSRPLRTSISLDAMCAIRCVMYHCCSASRSLSAQLSAWLRSRLRALQVQPPKRAWFSPLHERGSLSLHSAPSTRDRWSQTRSTSSSATCTRHHRAAPS